MPSPLRVLVAGGGVAGLEAVLALRHLAGERVAIELLSPGPDFVQRPASVATPFAGPDAPRLPLDPLESLGVAVHRRGLAAVDAARRRVLCTDGSAHDYGALVVAVGARSAEALPGAIHFRGPLSAGVVEGAVRAAVADPDGGLTFAVPAGATWPLPLYELALLAARTLAEHGVDDPAVTLVTPESRPLELFGSAGSRAVARLLDRAGVDLRPGVTPGAVFDGSLLLEGGDLMPAGQVVALPRLSGPRVDGLPHATGGFIPTDEHARVDGADHVFAAGDATVGAVKQGGLAAQQADAAAHAIARAAGVDLEPQPYRPVLRAMLATGDAPLYLRARVGDAVGEASERPLWQPPGKVGGRHLAGYLAAGEPALLLEDLTPMTVS